MSAGAPQRHAPPSPIAKGRGCCAQSPALPLLPAMLADMPCKVSPTRLGLCSPSHCVLPFPTPASPVLFTRVCPPHPYL